MGRAGVPSAPIVVAAVLVAGAFAFAWLRPSPEDGGERGGTMAPVSANPAAEAESPRTAPVAGLNAGPAIGTESSFGSEFDWSTRSPEPPLPRGRSPLESAPGYFPPDDPESASVITGRREAKAVDLPFSDGASTREDLAQMLLAGLNARDERALHALRVTREEFAVILWPEFPESRPITNIAVEDAWSMGIAQSVAGAGRAVGQNGGKDLVFLRVESAPPMVYRNFVLYRDVSILVRDRATGVEDRLHFAPSFVERKGRVKVLIFRD